MWGVNVVSSSSLEKLCFGRSLEGRGDRVHGGGLVLVAERRAGGSHCWVARRFHTCSPCISAASQLHLAASLLLSSSWDEAILCRFIHYKITPPPPSSCFEPINDPKMIWHRPPCARPPPSNKSNQDGSNFQAEFHYAPPHPPTAGVSRGHEVCLRGDTTSRLRMTNKLGAPQRREEERPPPSPLAIPQMGVRPPFKEPADVLQSHGSLARE